MTRKSMKTSGVAAMLAILIAGCSGDLTRSSTPIQLELTQTQLLFRYDISPTATGCNTDFSTVLVKAILLSNPNNANLPIDNRFSDVKLTSYRVSYARRDGGTLVPAPYTLATSGLVSVGSSTPLSRFVILRLESLNQAPFAALTPTGGGRDPETGLSTVYMDIVLEVFGETLAGERVSGSTRMSMKFCYACGGCA